MDAALRTILNRFKFWGDYLRVSEQTYGQSVAEGNIVDKEPLDIWGYNPNLVASQEPVWTYSGGYTWADADQTITVKSSSVNDDDGNTGAWVVRVWWLDAANVESTLDVTLDGTNLVTTGVTTCRRVNRVEVLTCGTGGSNIGNISVCWTDGTTLFAYVAATYGLADGVIQTVPAGKQDTIACWWCEGGYGATATFTLLARTAPTAPWKVRSRIATYQGVPKRPFVVPITFEAGTDYTIVAIGTGNVNFVSTQVNGWRKSI